jgi:uncharacterized membrane protein HdeD (DUF308 family)
VTVRSRLADDWPTAALFGLTFYVISITAFVPQAGANTLFRTLAQAIVITGLVGIALAWHYRQDTTKNEEIKRLEAEVRRLRGETM